MSAASANTARLIELERLWHVHMAAAQVRGIGEEQLNVHTGALVPIELEIASAPCDSRDAFMAKFRTVVRNGLIYGQMTAIDDAALIDGMIAYLEGEK